MTKQSRAKRIADLNDKFRKNLVTDGRTYMTAGVNTKGPEFVKGASESDRLDFNADNDPSFCGSMSAAEFGEVSLGTLPPVARGGRSALLRNQQQPPWMRHHSHVRSSRGSSAEPPPVLGTP